MTVLGIDPGYGRVGFGVVRREGSRIFALDQGLIAPTGDVFAERLLVLHAEVERLVLAHRPDAMATERLFFSKNHTTAMGVAQALGCMVHAAAVHGVPVVDFSPSELKLAVVGTGRAEKAQVQFMVTKLLGLAEVPKPDDVADALALALAYALRTKA